MSEKLDLTVEVKNATGPGFDDIERQAKARASKFKSIMNEAGGSGFSGGFGEEGASKSLRGLNHISKGFKEMMEGDILKGGAAIARGLQHSIGAAFSSIAVGAVGALGTAFASFKLGQFLDEKLGLSDKIAHIFAAPTDTSSWKATEAAIRAATSALEEYVKLQDKRIKASQETGNREIKGIKEDEANALRMIALEEKRAEIAGDKASPRRGALRTYAAKTDSLDLEEAQLLKQKGVLEGTATKLSVNADQKWSEAKGYAAQVKGSTAEADTLRLRELTSAARAAQKAFEEWFEKNGKTIQDTQEKLNAIPRSRALAKSELDTSTAEINAKKAKDEYDAAVEAGKNALKMNTTPKGDIAKPEREKLALLEKEKTVTEEKAKIERDNFDRQREALQAQLGPKPGVPGAIDRILGRPNLDAFGNAANEINMGMNPGALHAQQDADRRLQQEKDRFQRKAKIALGLDPNAKLSPEEMEKRAAALLKIDSNGRRKLTPGERALLKGMQDEKNAQTAKKALDALDKKAKDAAINSEKHLINIQKEIQKWEANMKEWFALT